MAEGSDARAIQETVLETASDLILGSTALAQGVSYLISICQPARVGNSSEHDFNVR